MIFFRFLQEILRNSRILRSWKSNQYPQTHITQNGQNRRKLIFRPAESRLRVNYNQVSKFLIDADQKSQRNLITLGNIPRLRSEFSNISLRYLISIVNDTKGWNQLSRSIVTLFTFFYFVIKTTEYSQLFCGPPVLPRAATENLSQARPHILPQFFWLVFS